MTGFLEAALQYAKKGYPVFPVRSDKAPLTPHGFKDATKEEELIRQWWTKFPDAGIGMPTGAASGIVVLDVDPRNGGDRSLQELKDQGYSLQDGPSVLTGGGGVHYWFFHPWGNLPVVHGFRPGLDFQGEGAYVILPPSRHPSGNSYCWEIPLGAAPLPPVPEWLLNIIVQGKRPTDGGEATGPRRTFSLDSDGKIPHGRHHDFIVSTAAAIAARVPGISFEALHRQLWGAMKEALDDVETHSREIVEAARSAILKFGKTEATEAGGDASRQPPIQRSTPDGGSPPPPQAPASPPSEASEFPPDLFLPKSDRRGGGVGWTPNKPAFVDWFRRNERFVVPVEQGTFSSTNNFELLRYEQGYYNGHARAFLWGRIEDAHRRWVPPNAGNPIRLSSSVQFRSEVIGSLAATSEFHRKRSEFNPPDLLCLQNGILDLRTLELRPHTPDVVFTWKLPVSYDPAATCPRFEQFLEEVMPDPKRRELLVDIMGYFLWRRNPFQVMFICVGDGANGKTTWFRVIEAMLGPEAIATESLQSLASQRFATAELEGKLANLCDDLPFDKPIAATGILKILTGEGKLTAEKKFLPRFSFRFDGKLIANANQTPEVRDDTGAFWRRVIVIPWELVVPPEKRDPNLVEKLVAELPGILNLALKGLARCRNRQSFDPDGVFEGSREEWHMRADPVRADLLEDWEPDPDGFVPTHELYEWHVKRCQEDNREPLGDRAFGKRFVRVFPNARKERRLYGGHRIWGYSGVNRRKLRPTLDESALGQ